MDKGEKIRLSSTCCCRHSDRSFCPKTFTEFEFIVATEKNLLPKSTKAFMMSKVDLGETPPRKECLRTSYGDE